MTFTNMQTDVRDRLSKLSTSTFLTTTMIKRWLNTAMHWSLTYKKWPHLEYKDNADVIDATGIYAYPTGMKAKSIFLVRVDSERYVKIRFEDYLKYLEDYETGDNKVWAEWDENIYINGNACTVGDTIEMYGQKTVSDLSADGDTTIFHGQEDSADEAIVLKAVAIGLEKEGKDSEAKALKSEAMAVLEQVWDRIAEAQPREVLKGTQFMKRINVLQGTTAENNNTNIGRF